MPYRFPISAKRRREIRTMDRPTSVMTAHPIGTEMSRFLDDLASRQEPLGTEFDKAWSENVDKLYES